MEEIACCFHTVVHRKYSILRFVGAETVVMILRGLTL